MLLHKMSCDIAAATPLHVAFCRSKNIFGHLYENPLGHVSLGAFCSCIESLLCSRSTLPGALRRPPLIMKGTYPASRRAPCKRELGPPSCELQSMTETRFSPVPVTGKLLQHRTMAGDELESPSFKGESDVARPRSSQLFPPLTQTRIQMSSTARPRSSNGPKVSIARTGSVSQNALLQPFTYISILAKTIRSADD